jgi:hypothetical protein
MSHQGAPQYALAYFAQRGFDGAFDAGPFEEFDPEWVQGDMLVFRVVPDGVAQLALREMASNAAAMSLDLTMGLAKFLRSPGITRDQVVLCEMALARSPWVHDDASAQWVRRDGTQLARQPLGKAFHAAFDNNGVVAAAEQPDGAGVVSVRAPGFDASGGRAPMVSVARDMLLRLAQVTVDLQCEKSIQQVNPELWKTMQAVVADLVREHITPQEFAQARAERLRSVPTGAVSAGLPSLSRAVGGRTRGERYSSVRASPPAPSPSVSGSPSRAATAGHHLRPTESGAPRRAERFRVQSG